MELSRICFYLCLGATILCGADAYLTYGQPLDSGGCFGESVQVRSFEIAWKLCAGFAVATVFFGLRIFFDWPTWAEIRQAWSDRKNNKSNT